MLPDLESDPGVMVAPTLRAIREEVYAVFVEVRPNLVAILRSYRFDPDEVDDLIQTITLKALSFTRGVSELRGWLFRVTRNAAIDLLRAKRRKRTRFVPWVDADQLAYGRDSIIKLDESDERDALHVAIDRLPRDLWVVVNLRLDERTLREIAALLDLSESAVRHRLARAIERLRSTLGSER